MPKTKPLGEETITWQPPTPRPKDNEAVLIQLPASADGGVVEGFWDEFEQAWMFGLDGALYVEEADVVAWAKMPKGIRRARKLPARKKK